MEKDTDKVLWLSPLVTDQGFSVQFREDHVHIELGKDFTVKPEKREVFWGVIATACAQHETSRVLVEGFLPEGEREVSHVIDAGQKTATVPRLWLAFAVNNFAPTEQTELYEKIAAMRGVRVKFFTDSERALNWLRQNSPQ